MDENRTKVGVMFPTSLEIKTILTLAKDALAYCYDVCDWPANGNSKQDRALEEVESMIRRLG